ncbi:putative frataxin-like, mitochondrial precursor [Trypanosoma cruzi]|uniref:ferroxidase n=2 Tax=Trypanosoma cruzi TaxID=5693 RepID=Q4D403_TRYCC|nr:frataxin-like, mitochondrial precursor, putative [Trypanosoma cruzi]EAN87256.1 frataxin-like, mitochondrial precursor, putative [Trypanosoma cruzi]PWV05606.1 putative frataxin-like, mitochondrial precursor [Trypanosoma cruzi]RNC40848.1 frataxin-like, mitochondrial precursor [Trypanosoma cruzi]|eukprot:XP_809107.1 frataxin-like, mitochondrial precursor [Trypanosoma cruzi strain CL Brener]
MLSLTMRRVAATTTTKTAAAIIMPSCLGTRVRGMNATSLKTICRCGTTTRVALAGVKGQTYSRLGMDGFTDVKYNNAADLFLEHVENVLESVDSSAIEEVNLLGGVLSVETVSSGTFVLNKQAPNVQLWLSSPVSGPHHYDMVLPAGKDRVEGVNDVQWLADSDGHSLKEKLERELTETLGVEVKL